MVWSDQLKLEYKPIPFSAVIFYYYLFLKLFMNSLYIKNKKKQ